MQGPPADPIVSKYISAGLSREAVPLAVANYGDNPTKVISLLFYGGCANYVDIEVSIRIFFYFKENSFFILGGC